jgi:hypothetical protein
MFLRILNAGLGLARGQKGQGLIFVLITMTFGFLVITGLLHYVSTSLRAMGKNTDQVLAYYAADAGVSEVVKDLLQGIDALDAGYTVPSITVNDYDVTISIAAPTPGATPSSTYHYVDPGASAGLSPLTSQTHYCFRIDNVEAGSDIRINWAFTPDDDALWQLALYEGAEPPPVTTLASDDFESGDWEGGSGWLDEWYHSGDAEVTDDGDAHDGEYHLRLRRANGYVDRAVDLSGQTNVRLQFWAKVDSFEGGDFAEALVSPDDVNWTVVKTWTAADSDDDYHYVDIDLSSFTMSSEFWIAFDAEMNRRNDRLYIDDLRIVSQPALGQASDDESPGTLAVDGSEISGGTYLIDFYNGSDSPTTAAAYSSTGGSENTWVYGKAYKDYLITSEAGTSTVSVFARQVPGPTDPITQQTVAIETWRGP